MKVSVTFLFLLPCLLHHTHSRRLALQQNNDKLRVATTDNYNTEQILDNIPNKKYDTLNRSTSALENNKLENSNNNMQTEEREVQTSGRLPDNQKNIYLNKRLPEINNLNDADNSLLVKKRVYGTPDSFMGETDKNDGGNGPTKIDSDNPKNDDGSNKVVNHHYLNLNNRSPSFLPASYLQVGGMKDVLSASTGILQTVLNPQHGAVPTVSAITASKTGVLPITNASYKPLASVLSFFCIIAYVIF